MTNDLILRAILVSGLRRDHDLFREAASVSKAAIELVEAKDAAAAQRALADSTNVVFLDAALPGPDIAGVTGAARAAPGPPFTVLLAPARAAIPFETDALAAKPATLEEAIKLIDGVVRIHGPSRILVVDDSSTMRAIVRKILSATRFPLEITEVQQGIEAIELARKVEFDIVFLDYNMPGFTGLETLAEFRREGRHVAFVLMTSTPDAAIAERARSRGAAFLKKPFFPADIEAILCQFYGLRALNPRRA